MVDPSTVPVRVRVPVRAGEWNACACACTLCLLGMWHTLDVTHGLHVTARHNAHTALRLPNALVDVPPCKRQNWKRAYSEC